MATAAPNQNLPIFYRAIEPLNVTQHGKMKVRPVLDMSEVAKTHAIPLTVDEFAFDVARRRELLDRLCAMEGVAPEEEHDDATRVTFLRAGDRAGSGGHSPQTDSELASNAAWRTSMPGPEKGPSAYEAAGVADSARSAATRNP